MLTTAQYISTFGFSPVLAFTRRRHAHESARATDSTRSLEPLLAHFSVQPDSQLAQASGAAAAADSSSSGRHSAKPNGHPRVYPNLGIIYGTVDRQGLDALRRAPEVARVTVAPQLSLIRPVASAAASLRTQTTWGIRSLGAPELWANGLTGKGVKIAHLDTGVDAAHPALQGAIASYAEFDFGGRRVTGAKAHDTDLVDGHGTHTAATIAARAVSGRHVGVAPGAVLCAATVIDGGDITARILAGMDWAVTERVKIISVSLGIRGYFLDFVGLIEVLRDSGVLPVVAVGNEGPGTSRSPGNYPKVVSVGFYNERDVVADDSSSQRFPRRAQPLVPDIVAPGEDVVSAAPGGRWRRLSGSSMAVPHVTGLAALLLEAHPAATVSQLERAIQSSAKLGTLSRDRANRGAVNAARALAALDRSTRR